MLYNIRIDGFKENIKACYVPFFGLLMLRYNGNNISKEKNVFHLKNDFGKKVKIETSNSFSGVKPPRLFIESEEIYYDSILSVIDQIILILHIGLTVFSFMGILVGIGALYLNIKLLRNNSKGIKRTLFILFITIIAYILSFILSNYLLEFLWSI